MKKIRSTSFIALAFVALCSCGGSQETDSSSVPDGPAAPAVASGKDLYVRNCASCHLAGGEGIPDTYPPLAGSDFLADREHVITQVIKGKSGEMVVNGKKYNSVMPPQQLNDAEVASVLSYVYSSFGNSGGPVTVDEVKAIRAKL